MSRNRTSASQNASIDGFIYRKAIDGTAIVGSLYNAREDCIVGKVSMTKPLSSKNLYKAARCDVIKGSSPKCEDFLNMIDIDGELWLSLILKSVPATGIASLIDSTFPIDQHTRFLHYYYSCEEKYISNQQNSAVGSIQKSMPDLIATHIVTTVKLGIEVLIVLQLSPGDQTDLDYLLDKISKELTIQKFELTEVEKPLLKRILSTTVYSDIPDLVDMTSFKDICLKINLLKSSRFYHRSLRYVLRPIKWFYPSYSTGKATYTSLEPETIKIIKEYLLPLSIKIKQLQRSVNPEVKMSLKEHFGSQIDEVHDDRIKAEDLYSAKIERIRKLLFKIRSGTLPQEPITEVLIDESEELLQNKLELTTKRRQALIKKAELINDLKQQDIRYMNVEELPVQNESDLIIALKKLFENAKPTLIFCSDDDFRENNSLTWKNHLKNLINDRKAHPSLDLVYADFSYSLFRLSKMKILPFELPDDIERQSSPRTPVSPITEGTIPQKEQPIYAAEQPNPSKTPTPSASEDVPPSRMQPEADKKPPKSSRSPEMLTTKDSTQRKEMPFLQFEDADELIKVSKTLGAAAPTPFPRQSKQSVVNEKPLNSPGPSSTNSRAFPKEQTNYEGDQSNESSSSKISPPPPAPRAKKQPTNTEELVHSPILLPTECISPSEDRADNTTKQTNSSRSSTISTPETTQRTEENSADIDEQVKESESLKLSTVERTSSSTKKRNHEEKRANPPSPPTTSHSQNLPSVKKHRPESSHSPVICTSNVLLLGESGVGKSTFINALVNYLEFDTLKQAHSEKPLVVMPVSFMMTVGDHFEEKIIRFGGIDPNEDHHHPGQSVTQQCRSYVFPIGTKTKLRIIDTPGMGDTRGLDQDDLNMQHILSFINNLPHLNAICILLKPNESRLNVVLRSYFTRLLNFLGENARNNIVFCFTNTRATFFAPGNTGPLLRKMINDLPVKDIPFKKTNTFCFDSEAFRYLIALQNGIEFDKYQEDEYERSWISSVRESNRLLEYICGGLVSYSQNEWQSIEHAQSKISQMIRPILETIRNIFRNIILLKENSSKKLIKLVPKTLSQPSAICYKCDRAAIPLCDFWILPDDLHNLEDKCQKCKCGRQKHVSVDYQLEYDSFDVLDGQSLFIDLKSDLEQLRKALLEFAHLYAYVFYTTKQNDPVLSGLNRMIAEENQVPAPRNTTSFNSILHELLTGVKKDYVEHYDITISCRKPINLPNINKAIEMVSGIDMVSEQMDFIKKAQKKYMKEHEKQIS